MKPNFLLLPLVVLFSITGLISCNPFDKSDECEGSEMVLIEPIIYLRVSFADPTMTLAEYTYLEVAERMIISGSIQKMYCSGKLSGYFTYSPTFYPQEMTITRLEGGFFLPQPYQYKFENTKDEILILFRIKVYMTESEIYESDEFIMSFFPEDIEYDVNTSKYYLSLEVVDPDKLWNRVTS
jgi:hypothetical protein